jgi:cytochrome c5
MKRELTRVEWLLIIIILLVSGLLGFLLSLHHFQTTTPAATQTMQTFHYPTLFVAQLRGDPRAGEKIFKEYCASCHAPTPIIEVSAPRVGDQKAWQFRRQLGIDVLLKITVNGVGAMPARGGCFECSDEQLRETIRYMLNVR